VCVEKILGQSNGRILTLEQSRFSSMSQYPFSRSVAHIFRNEKKSVKIVFINDINK